MEVSQNARKNRENLPERLKPEPSIDRVPEMLEPSPMKKFISDFIATDIQTVKEYTVTKVLKPRLKSMVLDLGRTALEMFIMGPNGVTNRSYNNYSNSGVVRDYNASSKPRVSNPGSTFVPYSDPILETEDEALDVIDDMKAYVQEYPFVRISDYLTFCNVPEKENEYTYQSYGWTADVIRRCIPEQIPDGRWVIKLPRPRYLT